jgi:hypothetical protein
MWGGARTLSAFQTEAEAQDYVAGYSQTDDSILSIHFVDVEPKQLTPKQKIGTKREYGQGEKCKHCGANPMAGAQTCMNCSRDKHESAIAHAYTKAVNTVIDVLLYVFFIGLGILLVVGLFQSFSDSEPSDFRQERQFDRFGY